MWNIESDCITERNCEGSTLYRHGKRRGVIWHVCVSGPCESFERCCIPIKVKKRKGFQVGLMMETHIMYCRRNLYE